MDSPRTAINPSEARPENERAASNKEAPKLENENESHMYNSTSIRSSGDIDPSTNPALTGLENTTPVSTKNKSDGGEDHEDEEEDEFGEVEDDSEPDLEGDPSNFEMVGSRGRVANPVAGSKSIRSK